MVASTNPDWPDPSEWARRLHDRLEKIGEDYLTTPWEVADDPEEFAGLNLKQARAAEALLAVNSALQELPAFKKSKGAAVLHDVAGALRDVVNGSAPRLFTPVPAGTPGGDGIHRNYVKVWVLVGVKLLIEAHDLSDSNARATVVKIFSKAGATGRKGNPLSASTIRHWCEKAHPLAANRDDAHIYREVESLMKESRANIDWPGSYDAAISWIERTANHPLLATKYG